MLFESENNCNNSIDSIIKDKITLINSNNNNLINFNLTSNLTNLNNLNELNKLSLNNKPNNNENANYFQSICSIPTPSRQDLGSVNPLLLSPLEKENAKEIIQQKILDNVYITQKINKENQELAHYLANINNDNIKIKEDQQNIKNNVLLSPIDYNIVSNNSNNLLLDNDITKDNTFINSNILVNQIESTPDQNELCLGPTVYSPSQSDEGSLVYPSTANGLMSLENILNGSPDSLLATTNATTNALNPVSSILSTPDTSVLSSPLSNTLISSPESNLLSSPELYDNLSPELNLNPSTFNTNDITLEEYLLNQEIIKLQQEALLKINLVESPENQVTQTPYIDNGFISTPEGSPEMLNASLELLEPSPLLNIESLPLDILQEATPVSSEESHGKKRRLEDQDLEEEKTEETEVKESKKSKKENVINEGKPFIYVVTESDDEEEGQSSSEDDGSSKKKKYKKKYFVCSVCNHKSKRHYNVEVHMKTHEKNRPRPFVCDVCNKSFCRVHDLERHKVIHQEKMFSCQYCGKKFGRLDSLKRHEGCRTCVKRQQLLKNESN